MKNDAAILNFEPFDEIGRCDLSRATILGHCSFFCTLVFSFSHLFVLSRVLMFSSLRVDRLELLPRQLMIPSVAYMFALQVKIRLRRPL